MNARFFWVLLVAFVLWSVVLTPQAHANAQQNATDRCGGTVMFITYDRMVIANGTMTCYSTMDNLETSVAARTSRKLNSNGS